jgi:hypothetical protein
MVQVIKKFVSQLTVGSEVQIKLFNDKKYGLVDCKVDNIEWCDHDTEFESAILHLRLPTGDVIKQSWYTAETIRTYVY